MMKQKIDKPVHSKIGASSMHRWSVCPGSVKLSEGIKSESSVYAEEGTKAHEIAAKLLNRQTAPDCDPEMFEAINTYVSLVQNECRNASKLLIEHAFDLEKVRPGLYGTGDAVAFFSEEKLLRVYDYKHGQGIAVEVQEGGKPNVQLMYYGLGALLSTGFPCAMIELIIVQPRCYHPDGPVRRCRVSAMELLDFAADLNDLAAATESPNAPLVMGDHCRFCPAAGICPEIQKKAMLAAKEDFQPSMSYSPEKLGEILGWLPSFESWIKSVREFAYGEALHGREPPGWKLVPKRNSRRWRDEKELEQFLNKNFRDVIIRECYTVPELKSPAQIEKVLGKQKDILEPLIITESSGMTLVPMRDKRQPLKLDAKSEFERLE